VPVLRNRLAAARFVFIFGINNSPYFVKIDGVSNSELRLTPAEN